MSAVSEHRDSPRIEGADQAVYIRSAAVALRDRAMELAEAVESGRPDGTEAASLLIQAQALAWALCDASGPGAAVERRQWCIDLAVKQIGDYFNVFWHHPELRTVARDG